MNDHIEKLAEMQNTDKPPRYEIKEGCMVWNKTIQEGVVPTFLCNFMAEIIAEETVDDGAERKKNFAITGKLQDGTPLHKISIPAEKFQGLNWVTEQWGAKAVVFAGTSAKDHLRVAIQTISKEFPSHVVFQHLGWRDLTERGNWAYIHAGGAIGASGSIEGVNVSPGDSRLKSYVLPSPLEGPDLVTAIRASLDFLTIATPAITYPLLSMIYRAPLSECFKTNFVIWVAGRSGTFKTCVSALAQAHYGKDFNHNYLPGNWSSTDNALEKQAFLAKDSIFVIDDFAPHGSAIDVARLHGKAERLIRANGNQAGRGRMNSNTGLRASYYPRAGLISSGEEVLRGHSARARIIVIGFNNGDVSKDKLTVAQDNAKQGLFSQAMSGYIKWLASKIERLKESLPEKHTELRTKYCYDQAHHRTPDATASLGIGLEMFLQFAFERGAITERELKSHTEVGWEALKTVASNQGEYQASEDPVVTFLEYLQAALSSGKAHVCDATTGLVPYDPQHWGWKQSSIYYNVADNSHSPWSASGDKIGWLNGNELFLQPENAFGVAQTMARNQNDSLPLSKATLLRRMAEGKWIRQDSDKKTTLKRTILGKRQRVIVFPSANSVLSIEKSGALGAEELKESTSPTESEDAPNAPLL